MKASIGRIVHYVMTVTDCDALRRRRVENLGHDPNWPAGAQGHVGNYHTPGQEVPLIIVVPWGGDKDSVNGQVILDGNDTLWVTSAPRGTGPGTWHPWEDHQKEEAAST